MRALLLVLLLLVVVVVDAGSGGRRKQEAGIPEPVVTESGEELWYTPGFYNKDVASEIAYLQAQCDIMWVREKEIFDAYLPKAAFTKPSNPKDRVVVADIGCGPGATSAELLRHYPGVFVQCVDVQQVFIDHAAKSFGSVASSDRFETRVGTALNSTLADGYADVVLARLTLQHIPKIQSAIAELHRITKPGGRLFIIDTDESMGDFTVPRVEAVEELTELHSQMRADRAHAMLSLHLWDWLTDAGYAVKRFDTSSIHSSEHSDIKPYEIITSPTVFYALSSKGLVSAGKVSRAVAKWKNAIAKSPLKMTVHFFYFVAERPLSGAKREL